MAKNQQRSTNRKAEPQTAKLTWHVQMQATSAGETAEGEGQTDYRQTNFPTFALFLPPLAAAAVLPAALLELPAVHKAGFIAIRFVAEQPF